MKKGERCAILKLTGGMKMKDKEKRIACLSAVPSAEVVIFESIDSTNSEARRRAASGNGAPALIIANSQTAGRGRLGRSFYSPESTGLYMTAVFEESCVIESSVLLTTAAAVSVARAIERLSGITVGIKWVNDLYLNEKKICGILCESFEACGKRFVSVGIGVNLCTEDFPAELSGIAGSLGINGELKYELAADIFGSLWSFCQDGSKAEMLEYYRAHSCVLGKKIIFYENGVPERAVAQRIDDFGRLEVILENGKAKILSSGEITLRLDKEN